VPVANRTSCGGSNVCCNGTCCDGCCGADGACGACLVFITSTTHTGDLNGLAGADAICQTRADSVAPDLPGSYKAWLSTGASAGQSPARRFRRSGQPYRLVNSTNSIAASFADLTDGTLANPITLTEAGNSVSAGWAWTNTAPDGVVDSTFPAFDCGDWAEGTDASSGSFGVPTATSSGWTDIASTYCDIPAHLYCFQQD
jgi:hypothetical protein